LPALDLDEPPRVAAGRAASPAAPAAPAQRHGGGPVLELASGPAFGEAPTALAGPRGGPLAMQGPRSAQPAGSSPQPAAAGFGQQDPRGGGALDVDFQAGLGPRGQSVRPAAPPAQPQMPFARAAGMHSRPPQPMGGWQPPAEPRQAGRSLTLLIPVVLLVAALGVVALVFLVRGGVGGSSAQSSSAQASTPGEIAACEALRRRLREGGSGKGLSRAGWAVELWLRGPNGAAIDPASLDLTALKGTDPASTVEVGKLSAPGRGLEEGVVVRLRGPVAEATFDEEGANRLIKVADLAFERSKAEAGSLTMSCAHLPHREVGLWFRGKDPTHAAASLMFAMAVFSDATIIRAGALDGPEFKAGMTMFERVRLKLQGGRADNIQDDLALRSGTVEPMKERGGVRITFPTDRLPEALKASRIVADKAGVENF
jgi:hypothetical protein